jgi:hypothetical protein
MKKILLIITILIYAGSAGAQIYADSETYTVNGLCVGCYANNPSHAADGSATTHSELHLTVGTAGAKIYQNLKFSVPGMAGDYLGILVEEPSLQLMDPTLLSGVTLTTFSNNVSNNDTKTSSQYSISALPGQPTRFNIQFHATSNFDAVQLDLNAGYVGALTSIRIYYGFHTLAQLPIELLDFKAEVNEENILLKWNMQKEEQGGYYVVERSSDAVNYKALGSINSKGASHSVVSYELIDAEPIRGQSYYRLRRYSQPNSFKTLSLITAQFASAGFSIFPNPAGDMISFTYSANETDHSVIEIYTAEGIKIKSYDLDPLLGKLSVKENLPQGIYHYFYKVNGETMEKGKLLISN